MSVTAITATSISLSWSVPSGSVVTSSEVMWREASSGTSEGTSGSLTDTSYTIDQLESTTIYTITVTVSNTAGSTDSHPITSKGQNVAYIGFSLLLPLLPVPTATDCERSNNGAISVIGGVVVAVVFMITIAVTVIAAVVVLGCRSRNLSTGAQKGYIM